jgi:two-component system chemotaxis sensor kinase CheA
LPIVWLDKVLGLDASRGNSDASTNIAVVTAGEFYYGIVVDHFTDSEEIVVKPLGTHLRDCHAYASATILGDGSAALILDVNGIAELVNITNQNELAAEKHTALEQDEMLQKAKESVGEERSLLIVENGEDEYFGIELAYVNRIERIRESSIEQMAHKNVIKYRGGVLRIFKLDEAIETSVQPSDEGHVYLIVFYMMGTEVAVMVSNIVDIVDTHEDIDNTTFHSAGIAGSTIIMDRITLLVDLFELVKVIDPAMVAGNIEHKTKSLNDNKNIVKNEGGQTVLVVEDSVFFQDKLSILLEEMNLNILVADDGQIGWDMLSENAGIVDLILMDIEMPNMTGLELSRIIRADERFYDIPIIMLTSLAKETDVEEGKKAGASEYLIKMDQEMVRHTVNRYLDHAETLKAGQLNADTQAGEGDHVRD